METLLALEMVRVTEAAAIASARLMGRGDKDGADHAAVEIALHKAADRATMSVLASDAYFPFADAIQLAAERGITAIIQPGGSARDQMAIEVADRHHMAMVFTGRRHYRH